MVPVIEDAHISSFVQVGQVARSHGLTGELKILLENPIIERLPELELMYMQTFRGDFFPCRLTSFKVDGKGNKISFFVQFEHIADRHAAEALKGKPLFVDQKEVSLFTEESDQNGYMDYELLNENNDSVGLVIDSFDNGAHLVVTVATPSGSLLIPLVDEFVAETNHHSKIIHCKNLDLLEGI